MKRLAALILIACAAGCGNRTVLIPPGTPVQLAEPAQVHVYVTDPQTGQKVKSGSAVTIPEGYVAFPPDMLK